MFDETELLKQGSEILKQNTEILEQLFFIKQQNSKIMALIDDLNGQIAELSTKADALQATVDSEQADIKALLDTNAQVVTDLNTEIASLKEQLANGATPEQLQASIDGITAVAAKIQAASDDVASTV